jgi:hypothetical protein
MTDGTSGRGAQLAVSRHMAGHAPDESLMQPLASAAGAKVSEPRLRKPLP